MQPTSTLQILISMPWEQVDRTNDIRQLFQQSSEVMLQWSDLSQDFSLEPRYNARELCHCMPDTGTLVCTFFALIVHVRFYVRLVCGDDGVNDLRCVIFGSDNVRRQHSTVDGWLHSAQHSMFLFSLSVVFSRSPFRSLVNAVEALPRHL